MDRQLVGKPVIFWLFIVIAMTYSMVLVGGLTRLTNSGLSMVDWKPIMGIIPPLSEESWMETFNAYRQFPEYQKINKGMSLDDFKSIFYWEYGHRVLGRMIGIVFFVPFLYFLIRRRIKGSLVTKLFIAFVLGGLQGLLGWYMVKSGLVDEPRVSQYRLAAHLGLAFILLSYLYWILLGLTMKARIRIKEPSFRGLSVLLLFIVSFQIFYGALTAGLDAGLVYNTFPDMNGRLFPAGALSLLPTWKNLFENPVTVQFIHRCLGWLTLGIVFGIAGLGWLRGVQGNQRLIQWALLLAILFQFGLGVATLVMHVPVAIASLHQAGAAVVLILAVTNLFIEWRSIKDRVGASF
ncbi:COX15/CtaA family protein [Pseudobacteriovorax antillogorgiicola]|uniref:Cytochrome c oxidase assembly protein subunit 15 n=1 Tax=Pseudobacteriovorax antillogorgiicola TaxID=1513793 RepID=A0A1Y6BYF5_9BACT|nr:COX15/CtaA family protein [Pseudobacteriovorax antillogorgiicola]TCS50325.1 cytochrome c oxidase assembly protein subunit 15 [Pseudobacteriovorax antillogorgiicola]SMF34490.1 cytochrome c oxidase assembly protein subunit 15 [Pseudobacteriovorax antillogorgiicola]